MATGSSGENRKKKAVAGMKHLKKPKELAPEQVFVSNRTRAINEYNRMYNKVMAPIRRELKSQLLIGRLSETELADLKNKERESFRQLKAFGNGLPAQFPLPDMSGSLEARHGFDTTKLEALPDWAIDSILNPEPVQPGVLVQGTGHPCCRWYARTDSQGWRTSYGPNLSPADYGVTGFSSNWKSDNQFQLCFGVTGTHDDEHTTYYSAQTTFHSTFEAVRHGRIYFTCGADFRNAYLYARGSSDFWDSDDYGWAGAYYWLNIRRVRNGNDDLIFNSRNYTPSSAYFNTSWVPILEVEATSAINANGWPGGANAAWFTPIPDMARSVATGNNGSMIRMETGDLFNVTLAFLFDVQAFGDEKATGGVQICSAYGNESYVEVDPVTVYLEECPDD